MSKRRELAVTALCVACLILIIHQIVIVNSEIQSRTPQQQQASVQRSLENIDFAFDALEKFLEKPLVKCVITGFIENQKHQMLCNVLRPLQEINLVNTNNRPYPP